MDTTKTIELLKPVKLGDMEYAELTLTEPTMKQMRQSAKAGDGMDQLATLIHLNAAVPMAVVDQLGQRDIGRCQDFFDLFNSASPQTPST